MKEYFEDLGNYLSLKDRAYQNIKFQIIRGNLRPGTRLLEEELAKAMSISRAPIREAFINRSENAENRIQYLALDKKFHDLLSQNCSNKKLIVLLDNLQEQIHWLRNISLKRITFADSAKEHLAIMEALKKNDKELINKVLLQHLERAKKSSLEEINS